MSAAYTTLVAIGLAQCVTSAATVAVIAAVEFKRWRRRVSARAFDRHAESALRMVGARGGVR